MSQICERQRVMARWVSRRRGTSMIEFVMVIPLLALILAATFFIGWAMKNQQRVRVADRYAAWAAVYRSAPTAEDLNEKFFQNRAYDPVLVDSHGAGYDVLESFVQEITAGSASAGTLADDLVHGHFPHGRAVRIEAEFRPAMSFWRHLSGHIKDRHVREGREWRRRQAEPHDVLRDQYLQDLDSAMQSMAGGAQQMGQAVRDLYLRAW